MMLVPVTYIGFKYWDKHHRGRRRRAREAVVTGDVLEEPPTFREFLESYMYHQDEVEHEEQQHEQSKQMIWKRKSRVSGNPAVANAILAELNQIFEPMSPSSPQEKQRSNTEDESTMGLTSSYSFSTAEGESEEDDSEEEEEEMHSDEESLAGEGILSLVDGLEYESEEEAFQEEEINSTRRVYGVAANLSPRRNKKATHTRSSSPSSLSHPEDGPCPVSWGPSFGRRLY